MKVRPLENYRLLGTAIVLDNTKVYSASHAENQPNWKEKGLIFVHESDDDDCVGVLLCEGEYEVKN
jgi:hypothetical protein